ncbi:MAG TPA: ATP-binding protein [Labilithrix sp.]
MSDQDALAKALGPESGTAYRLSCAVAEQFPRKAVVEGLEGVFDLDEYATAGRCEVRLRETPHAQLDVHWRRKHGLVREVATAMRDVTWDGRAIVVVTATWPEGWKTRHRHWVIADERAIAERFAAEVCAYCNEPREALLVFRGGCWSKNHELWEQIQASSFDDLVLPGALKDQIRGDFSAFLSARDEYTRYGVPWKRGVLFLGPPGNGKTHCLRATIKMLGVPCLYVQSLKAKYETDDANIAAVFDRAREVAPCALVFEDLDAMITPENRSVFLNELDGFANASGLLTLATTNHPEKLDASILERPSRFDRKYAFPLPAPAERARYIAAWNARLDPAMGIAGEELERLVVDTDGFSFAYLKELFLSSMIRWMKTREAGGMFAVLHEQQATLRAQMTTEEAAPKSARSVAAGFDAMIAQLTKLGGG